jgi:hypothetical protein
MVHRSTQTLCTHFPLALQSFKRHDHLNALPTFLLVLAVAFAIFLVPFAVALLVCFTPSAVPFTACLDPSATPRPALSPVLPTALPDFSVALPVFFTAFFVRVVAAFAVAGAAIETDTLPSKATIIKIAKDNLLFI